MNYILKLWTSILTNIGTHTAETEGIFSDTSDGFRAHRQIYDSLTTHIVMYEGAKTLQEQHIHIILRLQGCLWGYGLPNTIPNHEGLQIP